MAYVPNSGSVVAFQSNPSVLQAIVGLNSTNASVITVGNQNVSGSVVAFQGTSPWAIAGSVAAFQAGQSSTSITGTITVGAFASGASVYANASVYLAGSTSASVITVQQGSIAVAIVSGSIAASFTPPANQSVSGTVQTDVRGSVATVIIGGSIAASFVPPANQSVSGTVTVNQGTNPWVQTGSVQGTMSVLGTVPVTQATTPWVVNSSGSIAAVIIGGSVATATTNSSVMILNGGNMIGSIAAYQGATPWVTVGSVYQGVGWSGSVAAVQLGTRITSLVSTTPSSVQVGASIMGTAPVNLISNTIPASALAFLGATSSVPANISSTITVAGYNKAVLQLTSAPSMTATVTFQGSADNSSWRPLTGYNTDTNVLASVTTLADANWVFDVAGLQTFRALIPSWTAGSVTGKVYLSPSDARPQAVYVSNSTPSSLLTGASIVGQLPAGTAVLGSIVTYPGANQSVSGTVNIGNTLTISAFTSGASILGSASVTVVGINNSSIITVNQNSSILAVPVGSVQVVLLSPSIVGTYAEDAASASGDKGFLVMGARNDTLASVTSADGDYSSHVVGPSGELIAANAPFTKWVSGTASMLGGVPLTCSVTVIAAQGSSIFTYITGVQIVNFGPSSVLVSLGGATSSIVGYTVAPAGGGSNIVYINGLKTNANAAFSASVSGTSSVYVSAQGFISKT